MEIQLQEQSQKPNQNQNSNSDQNLPDHTVTLNELLASAAAEWTPEHRLALISALRDQRERWNEEQAKGSRKRVTAKQIKTKPKGRINLALEGLQL